MFKIGDEVTFKKNMVEDSTKRFLFNPRDTFHVLDTGKCPCGRTHTVTLGAYMMSKGKQNEWYCKCCPNNVIVRGNVCNVFNANDVEKVVKMRSYVVENVEVSLELNPN